MGQSSIATCLSLAGLYKRHKSALQSLLRPKSGATRLRKRQTYGHPEGCTSSKAATYDIYLWSLHRPFTTTSRGRNHQVPSSIQGF
nr:DNA-directed RNA polymerases I, II, and III subunit RPABC4 isoform X1 [Pogona vitticeps]